jgi:hypothetical protein
MKQGPTLNELRGLPPITMYSPTPSKRKIQPKHETDSSGLIVLLVVAVISGLVWLAFQPNGTTDRLKYAAKYGVNLENVTVLPTPHDCDYDKAPLGNKECHYAAVPEVSVAPNGVRQVVIYQEKVQE